MERQGIPDPQIGSELAGYRIEAAIGRGGMSRVYRAEHLRLGRPVALKLLGSDLAEDPLFRARFEREWRLAVSLRHPHIVPIYDAGEEDGILYIAMLLVEGGDLSLLLRQHGAMDPDRALHVLAQIASALDAAHGQDLIHRDLKPSNVLLATGRAADSDDHAYLADFGLTKSVSSSSQLTLTGSYLGTPSYSSPEQIAGHTLDTRADVYALACMLFECLTGSLPYPRDSENGSDRRSPYGAAPVCPRLAARAASGDRCRPGTRAREEPGRAIPNRARSHRRSESAPCVQPDSDGRSCAQPGSDCRDCARTASAPASLAGGNRPRPLEHSHAGRSPNASVESGTASVESGTASSESGQTSAFGRPDRAPRDLHSRSPHPGGRHPGRCPGPPPGAGDWPFQRKGNAERIALVGVGIAVIERVLRWCDR